MSAESDPPADELDPDEPRTPLWLPLVGLGLFLAALVYGLVGSDDDENADTPAPAATEPAEQPTEQAGH